MRIAVAIVFAVLSVAPAAARPNPFPRAVLNEKSVAHWKFNGTKDGWQIHERARGEVAEQSWKLACDSNDPILLSSRFEGRGMLQFSVRMRATGSGPGQVFWLSDKQPGAAEERSARFDILSDGKWHTYQVNLPTATLTNHLRFDPIVAAGTVELDWIEVKEIQLHPLEIERTELIEGAIRVHLRNHGDTELSCSSGGQEFALAAKSTSQQDISKPLNIARPYGLAKLQFLVDGLPTVERRMVIIDSRVEGDWLPLGKDSNFLVAKDGSGVRLMRGGKVVGNIAPLVWNRQDVPQLKLEEHGAGRISFTGEGVQRLSLTLDKNDLIVELQSERDWESPVVRVLGTLEQGLLAGVEHLGRGESSSSTIDLHGPEHDRFETNPLNLTMPLMAVVTERASVAMLWQNNSAQPAFAVPNFVDGAPDHRMALKGAAGPVRIRVGDSFAAGERLEDIVLWAVQHRGGLPELPVRPRNSAAQESFIYECLTKSEIRAADGRWYHAMIAGGKYLPAQPHYFGDVASAMFRMDGAVPNYRPLGAGGSHIRNDAVFFLTGQAANWYRQKRLAAEGMYGKQLPDGSYRYDGEFRGGHFENTASGHCARSAVAILEYAKCSADQKAISVGCKTLDYMKRFRTP
ncbi:MAG: hypothetical protein ACI9HK_003285, partial [Pirellulaceae bacterium]